MRTTFAVAVGFLALGLLAAVPVRAQDKATLKLTPENTKIEFEGFKKDGSHKGGFKTLTGTVELAGDDFTKATITVEIDTESLYSDTPKLTKHLKSPDFFDVRNHPKASFTTTKIEAKKDKDATHVITGNLKLHGETKAITFPATVAVAGDGLTLTGNFTLSRKEFGISFGEGMIKDEVAMKVEVKAARK